MKTHKTPLGAVAHCFSAAQSWLSASQLRLPLPLAPAPTPSLAIHAHGRAQQQGQSGAGSISPLLAVRLGIETVQALGSGHLPSLVQKGQQGLPSYQWAPQFLHGVGCLRRPNALCICTNGWRWCWSLSAEESRALLPLPPKATSDRVFWHVFHLSHLRQEEGL